MNTMTKRFAVLSAALIVGASLLTPAQAQYAGHPGAPYAQSQGYAQAPAPWSGYGPAYNAYNQAPSGFGFDPVQARRAAEPNRCITDEGYGRWSYCDGGDE